MPAADERKEVRAQRHDFIKEYYKMATLDLDRHLKAGWQTIAVLAGGAAILTAGHDGKIGLPIAVSIALISAFWGALTVVDANYWSLRAIGFLANVEAVYFSIEDRIVFNPYVGDHPPYKLLNSLRYMLWLCLLFGVAADLSMASYIVKAYHSAHEIWARMRSMEMLSLLLWLLPVAITLWGPVYLNRIYQKRLRNYIEFSRKSPGPGLRTNTSDLWHITFEPIEGEAVPEVDQTRHASSIAELERRRQQLEYLSVAIWVVVGLVTGSILVFVVDKLVRS